MTAFDDRISELRERVDSTSAEPLSPSMAVMGEIAHDIHSATVRHVVTLTLEDQRPEEEIEALYRTLEALFGPVANWPGCVFEAQEHAGILSIASEPIRWATELHMKFVASPDRQHFDNRVDVKFAFHCVKDAIFFKLRWS
jgi:hypothetical protein